MVPFGRLFIEPWIIFNEIKLLGFLIYLVVSFGLFILGLILIEKGHATIEEHDRK